MQEVQRAPWPKTAPSSQLEPSPSFLSCPGPKRARLPIVLERRRHMPETHACPCMTSTHHPHATHTPPTRHPRAIHMPPTCHPCATHAIHMPPTLHPHHPHTIHCHPPVTYTSPTCHPHVTHTPSTHHPHATHTPSTHTGLHLSTHTDATTDPRSLKDHW